MNKVYKKRKNFCYVLQFSTLIFLGIYFYSLIIVERGINMAAIHIPERLNNKLNEDSEYLTRVNQLIMNTKNYFDMLNLKFFPEYTSHRADHVNRVLEIIDKLIPDDTLEIITPRSMHIVICAAIIHDLGMFIQDDGVCKLLWGDRKTEKTEHLDEKTWEELWNEFIVSASRYSDTQLIDAFGSKEEFKAPSQESEQWTDRDRLVIGEFLRRHHHRLAFEFCKNGFYGCKDTNIFYDTQLTDVDFIAIIARSHGMQIRDTEKYIISKYATMSKPLGIPIVYLMSLLRLADYLDAGECRAPQEILEAQHIKSKISVREWTWNQTIDFSGYSWNDKPDTLSIFSSPTDNITYLVVKNWLNSVQKELDMCWANICENCYDYKLSIHRIVSNITNPTTIEGFKKNFSVNEAKLNANPELLKLLIHPLYGNSPNYGVRELLQNAVDACIERQYLEKDNKDYEPLVTVSVDTKKKKFIITDNGIGMTEDVIINYFLSAGSSYRSSDKWKNDYSKDEISQISRTGKFGVGILSAFLIGETINVTTRSIEDEKGYTFSMPFENTNINLIRADVSEIGTKIEIDIDAGTVEWFLSNSSRNGWTQWYHFTKPKVEYTIDNRIIKMDKKWRVPNINDRLKNWYKIKNTEFDLYSWSYESLSNYRSTNFFVNGITIPTPYESFEIYNYGYRMKFPNVSIVDKNGNLDINLARSIVLSIPLKTVLIRELYKYVMAKLLCVKWKNRDDIEKNFTHDFNINERYSVYDNKFIVSSNGYTIYQNTFFKKLKIKEIVVLCIESNWEFDTCFFNSNKPVCVLHENKYDINSEFNEDSIFDGHIIKGYDLDYLPENVQDIWLTKEVYNYSEVLINEKIDYDYSFGDLEEYVNYHKDFGASPFDEKKFMLMDGIQAIIHYTEFDTEFDDEYYSLFSEIKENIMESVIEEYLGDDIWIPFDMEERKKKFPKAFKELKKYM